MTSPDDCASVLAAVADAYDGLHTLVYAAGPHVPMVHLSKVSPADFAEQLTQDAAGFFNLAQPALPLLRQTQGSIVAVTTAATARFPVRDGLSSAPKGAVEALVRALAAEEGRFGVRVNAVGPGMLTDGMAARLIDSGELSDEALAITRCEHPAAPVRQRDGHRRGRLLPGLGPRRIHHRSEARRRRRLHRLGRFHVTSHGPPRLEPAHQIGRALEAELLERPGREAGAVALVAHDHEPHVVVRGDG